MTCEVRNVDGFTSLLRRILLEDKQQGIKLISDALGLTPRTFYARLHNRSRFEPEEIAVLLRQVNDERLAKWLFARSDLVLVARSAAEHDEDGTKLLERATAGTAAIATALITLVDGIRETSLESKAELEAQIRHAQAELVWIKMHFESEGQCAVQPSPDGFVSLVRQTLLSDRGLRLRDMAPSLGLTYHNLHARMTGRVPFNPVELRKLFEVCPEPSIANYLLAGTSYVAVRLPANDHRGQEHNPARSGVLALDKMVRLLAMLPATKKTANIDRAVCQTSIDEALGYLAMLQWNTTYIGRQQPASNRSPAPFTGIAPTGWVVRPGLGEPLR